MPAEIETLVEFFKALADATRLRIVGLLAIEERTVDELAALVDVRPPTVSHHLARLKKLGLVAVRSEGNNRWYRLEMDAVSSLAQQVLAGDGLTSIGDDVEAAADDAYALKVFRTFMPDGRITRMPAQYRKRQVLVRYVAQQFEADRVYTEAEVNDVIRPIYDDYVSIRRALIDERWMVRDKAGRSYRLDTDRVADL